MRADRDDPADAEFDRLLDDPVHFVTRGQALKQAQLPGKLAFPGVQVTQGHGGDFSLKIKGSRYFSATTIEQNHGGPGLETAHPDVVGHRGWQNECLSR